MKNQVTTIEQSKRLIELGVPAQKASMVWYRHKIAEETWTEWELVCGRLAIAKTTSSDVVPAFTIGDLQGMIPPRIKYGRLYISHPTIPSCKEGWNVFYKKAGSQKGAIKSCYGEKLIDACSEMIEWLLSNGYKL